MSGASMWLRTSGVAWMLLALTPGPARAELQVHISRTTAGCYESLGITVTDPRGGSTEVAGSVSVTMADARDQRQTVYLSSTGKPGQWSGYFTPRTTGRFTGTAVLEREGGAEIGLVPRIQVLPSARNGFVRLHPGNRRVLRHVPGPALFPVGVSVQADDLGSETGAADLVARLRGQGLNYVEVAVPLIEEGSAKRKRTVDALLQAAERSQRLVVQVRFTAREEATDDELRAVREELAHCVRRWSYSPALAVWLLDFESRSFTPEQRTEWIQVTRRCDSYRHLIAVPAGEGAPSSADLYVASDTGVSLSSARPALLRLPETSAMGDGDSAEFDLSQLWRRIRLSGLGVPLVPYRPNSENEAVILKRLGQVLNAVSRIPHHAGAQSLSGTTTRPDGVSWSRYDRVYTGLIEGEPSSPVTLPVMPRGRYAMRVWDTQGLQSAIYRVVWSDGMKALTSAELPTSAYVILEPVDNRQWVRNSPANIRPTKPVKPAKPLQTYLQAVTPIQPKSPTRPLRKVSPASPAKAKVGQSKPSFPARSSSSRPSQKVQAKVAVKKATPAKTGLMAQRSSSSHKPAKPLPVAHGKAAPAKAVAVKSPSKSRSRKR